jgi:phosphoheptose isomerase
VRIVDVWLKRAFVTHFDVGYSFADGYHFEAELVARSSWIVKKRKFPEVAGKVGSTNAHTMSFDQSFAWAGSLFVSDFDGADFIWVGEFDCVRH